MASSDTNQEVGVDFKYSITFIAIKNFHKASSRNFRLELQHSYLCNRQVKDSLNMKQVIHECFLNQKIKLNEISMGMSSDYLKAIEYKSTYLRIGTDIFGKRN